MKKFILLTKNAIKAAFSNAEVGTSKKRKRFFIGLYIFLVIYMGLISMGMSALLFDQISEMGGAMASTAMSYIPVIMFFITTVFIFATSLFSASNVMFKAKDLEMQLAMPISRFTILSCRFAGLYILNLLFSVIVLVPNCIVYFLYMPFDIGALLMFLVAILLVPMIPSVLGGAISAIISFVLKRFRAKNFLIIAASFAFFYYYFKVFLNFENSIQYIVENVDGLFNTFSATYFPVLLFYKTITGSILHFVLYVAVSVIPVILLLWIIAPLFSRFVAAVNQTYVKSNFKLREQKSSAKIFGLAKKELSMFFSSAVYVLNTLFLLVILTVGSVYVIIKPESITDAISQLELMAIDFNSLLFLVILGALTSIAIMSVTTAPSISIEGNRLWIYKTFPVTPMEVFDAKVNVSLITEIPLVIINAIIYTLVFEFSIEQLILLIIIPSLGIFMSAQLGLIVNLLFPKLEWKNETMVVKSSMSVFIGVLLYMFIGIGIILFGYFALDTLEPLAISLIVLAFLALLSIAFRAVLKTYGTKKFLQLNPNS